MEDFLAAVVITAMIILVFILGGIVFHPEFTNKRSDCEAVLTREHKCVAVYVTPDQLKQIKGE